MVDECCRLARRLADRLGRIEGVDVVNDVVLNQVLARVGDEETTNRAERWIQEEGTCWLGATTWRGERLLRISISNWATSDEDIDRCVAVIAAALGSHP
jgi:threonine aldolase